MVQAKRKSPTSESVAVSAKLRQSHPWFEELTKEVKNAAVNRRRRAERTKGGILPAQKLIELSDELEEIQRQINPLDIRRKEIVEKLLAHWAHTGIEEIEGTLGKTLISLSFELGVDPKFIKGAMGEGMWQKLVEPMLQPAKLLALRKRPGIERIIEQSAKVRKVKVSVTAPSSRRPKSGAPEDDAGEESA